MLIKTNQVNFADMIRYPDIEIESGKVTFISGSSGCGKSSLLKLFNGVLSPASGEILINGINIEDLDTVALRKEFLLVSQSIYLFDETIAGNFETYCRYREIPAPDRSSMQFYLSLCCAEFPLEMSCTSMSGGERQRVYIAICLSFQPKVLMLDEPTSALDSQTADQMMQNLIRYCREHHITLIVVSHDKELVHRYADQIISLERMK